MSDGYRNGAFALGLVTGGGIVVNLVLWSAYATNHKSKAQRSSNEGNENQEGHPIIELWDWLIRTFVDPYDTIAQWGMMFRNV
jgi:hypothetical protein